MREQINQPDLELTERLSLYPHNLDTAYDLDSCGLGVHLHALQASYQRQPLAPWAVSTLNHFNSNFLYNYYVDGWLRPGRAEIEAGPFFTTPRNEAHLRLFAVAREGYERLERARIRLGLGGEAIRTLGDITAPFAAGEFTELLLRASQLGIIQVNKGTPIERVQTQTDAVQLMFELTKVGVGSAQNVINAITTVEQSPQTVTEFAEETHIAACRKLGCMIATLDQLTYDAQQLLIPFRHDYVPTHVSGAEHRWPAMLGNHLPNLGELYHQAFATLQMSMNHHDPHLAHVLELPHLSQLSQ